MSRTLLALILISATAAPAAADGPEQSLRNVRALQRVCRAAERHGPRQLYAVELAARHWSFDRWEPDAGFLPIDTRRNFRAFRGAAELFPAGMESMGFIASEERVGALRGARRAGARLRVGFFLGFDGTGGTMCLIRPYVGVTTVRMDVAFVELLDRSGAVLAREDTDRLRAWLDDQERDAVPGEGPRGAAGRAAASGPVPDAWQAAIARANGGAFGQALGRCHAEAGRGHARGQVVVRATVNPRTGAVAEAEVELTTLGNARKAECVARAVGALAFPPAPALFADGVVLSIPVRLIR